MADPLGSHPVGATRGEGVEDDVEAVAAMEDDRDDSGGGPELPALLPHPAPRKAKSSTATANRVHIGFLPVRVTTDQRQSIRATSTGEPLPGG